MSFSITLKINNQTQMPVRITAGKLVITWDWVEQPVVIPNSLSETSFISFIDQASYEIQIGTSNAHLGTNSFVGNLDTLIATSPSRQYRYRGPTLNRGQLYYGQFKATDKQGNTTPWIVFSFKYNSLPKVVSGQILPVAPSLTDNLTLSYVYADNDGDLEGQSFIRWYKNGVHQRQFDNQVLVQSSFLTYNDVWTADVLPHDGYEFGPRFTFGSVSVLTTPPVGDNLSLLPSLPNENDILKAEYTIVTQTEEDESQIRWFVNGILLPQFNDQMYVRLPVNVGDQVYYQLTPFDGVVYGSPLSSHTVTVSSSQFIVTDLKIEGLSEAIALPSTRPIFSWNVFSPVGRTVQYISVMVGTFAGGSNVFSTVVNSNANSFQMPANLLRRGGDYYVSVAVSDSQVFGPYSIRPFRLTGSMWENYVSNSTGWTLETSFTLPAQPTPPTGDKAGTYEPDQYQIIRFQDGTNFGEVRIYLDRFSFASSGAITSQAFTSLKNVNILTITGKGNDVKVYLNRQLIIDGTGAYTQTSTSKTLEVGTVSANTLYVNYRSFYYTVDGAYQIGDPNWKNIQFYSYADFKGSELSAIEGILMNGTNLKVIGVNPHDETQGGFL